MSEQKPSPHSAPDKIYSTPDQPIQVEAQFQQLDLTIPDVYISLGSIDAGTTGTLSAEATLERKNDLFGCYAKIKLAGKETPEACGERLQKKFGTYARQMVEDRPYLVVRYNDKSVGCVIMPYTDKEDGLTTISVIAQPRDNPNAAQHPYYFPYDTGDMDTICDTADKFAFFFSDIVNTLHEASSSQKPETPLALTLPSITPKVDPIYGETAPHSLDETQPIQPIAEITKTPEFLPEHAELPAFADLAGIDAQVKILKDIVAEHTDPKRIDRLKEYDLTPRRTFLLVGPPGVGKTASAQAVAKELRANLITIKPSDIVGSLVGETTKNFRNVFTNAQLQSKQSGRLSLVFFDEFDAVLSNNGGGNEGVALQVVNEAKLILQNIAKEYPGVLAAFATNETTHINDALIRAGRISETIAFTMPDNEARAQIFEKFATKYAQHFDIASSDNEFLVVLKAAGEDFDNTQYTTLAKQTEEFNISDIETVFTIARRRRAAKHDELGFAPPKTPLSELETIVAEYRKTRPNLN